MLTAEAIINLSALQYNYRHLKSLCRNKPLVAVVKGDAYGHSAKHVALTLSDVDMLAVARIEEAIELRNLGVKSQILLLEGCFNCEDLLDASRYQFQTVIHHQQQLEHFQSLELSQPIKVWLKLDTGMHRVGVTPEQLPHFIQSLQTSNNLEGELNFISHFSCADDLDSSSTPTQISAFSSLLTGYKGLKSIANSAGILFWPHAHFDVVRAGIALYGISPVDNKTGKELDLQPVMTLKSKLISVREHKANQPVGYGENWFSKHDTNIGVVALGYGDGYPRLAPEGTPVWINGRIVPIVGRVSMDMITVDLGANSEDIVGDEVEFWGNQLPIELVANAVGTIPYELTIKLTKRVAKRYIEI
ncbi:alanine racemase [Vibrio sp. TH_r3]|uniref:alanine racemase n=1 Tax=Vibrio sp. TH_r3 TaxID=3082084 RepID=UPI0029549509|nr:alanine racemase [Vibrio sp. TH_r3]MDV7103781.1 alanine racemase [Vibrio sp. TH_r3]